MGGAHPSGMHLFLFDPFDNSLLANREKKTPPSQPHPPFFSRPLSPLSQRRPVSSFFFFLLSSFA